MTMTLPIQDVARLIQAKFPAAAVALRRPAGAGKTWWLDFALGPTSAEVEWNPARGFGISVNSDSVFGGQSDEVYSSSKTVVARLFELVESGKQTEDASDGFVRALREARRLTQSELAKLLRIKQASVSRLESRSDFHVSTLRNIIANLGGNLEIRANFPDGTVHILKYQSDDSALAAKIKPAPAGSRGGKSRAKKSGAA